MSLKVVPYTEDWKDRWDQFVLQSNNGTLFHLQRFLEYHVERRFEWNHLLFLDGRTIVAVLPAAKMGSTLESPIGASYGSFVTEDIDFQTALAIVDAFSDYCRSSAFERSLLTPPPFIYQSRVSQNVDYALAYRGFAFDKHYLSHAIHLQTPHMVESFQSTARRYTRQYLREQELEIERSDDLEMFYPILLKNKQRHGARPTHSLVELQRLQEFFPEHLILFLAKKNKKPIAGSLLFRCNPRVALCFYPMMLYEYEAYHPMYAIMYEIIQWATTQGILWVDLGVSQDTKAEDPMTPAVSLIKFKERFAARGILRSTFYKRFL